MAAAAFIAGCAGRIHRDDIPVPVSRFVAEATNAQDVRALEHTMKALFGEGAEVRPLFDSDGAGDLPPEMQRMVRLQIPKTALPTKQPWENAYFLQEELAFLRVEPDLSDTLARTRESTALCEAEGDPPVDTRWSLHKIQAPAAWALPLPPGGHALGEGIRVCHPDTGWTEHLELDADRLDLSRALNLLGNGTADAKDPLVDTGPMLHPGHGTSTGSVIVSGHVSGRIDGVAPRARLVPIRTAKSVVQIFDSDLARAVNHAVDAQCDVISMSLGGRAFFGLKAAIERAVKKNLIVAAAAGNCVGFVVAPAAYDATLAISATNIRDEAWVGSSRGPAVDVAAPGEHVWVARRRSPESPNDFVAAAEGTSYAVANVAGSAALWLAYHGRDSLVTTYRGRARLQDVFRKQLQGSARVPDRWPLAKLGTGVLDVAALLSRSLPAATSFRLLGAESAESKVDEVAAVLGMTPARAGPILARMLNVSIDQLETELNTWGPELIHLALSQPEAFRAWIAGVQGAESSRPSAGRVVIEEAASPRLRAQLDR